MPTRYLVDVAVGAAHLGHDELDRAVAALSARSDAERCALDAYREVLDVLFDHGWQPHEIPNAAARLGSAGDDRVAAMAVAGWAARRADLPADWAEQIRGTGTPAPWPGDGAWLEQAAADGDRAAAIRRAVVALDNLHRLPPLETIGPGPKDWTAGIVDHAAGVDEKLLARVRALLAKAESTDYPEEAEALSAKAQELITRHSLDTAAVAAARGDTATTPVMRRVWFDRPYVDGKSLLLHQVAAANRCQTVFDSRLGYSTLAGYPGDLDVVEVLFTSLLVQATRAMVAAGVQRDRWGRSRTRSFRSSFLAGFASRIGERLRQAGEAATESVDDDVRAAALPVLASMSDAVDEAVREAFPHLRRYGVSVSHAGGYVAGQLAADRANLASGELDFDAAAS
ncbi:MAG: DUF2786 domain-containing protein [Acidimicrobiales bacterium]